MKDAHQNYVTRALNKHSGLYSYEETMYINAKNKIKITCKTHGVFEQMPYAHLNGQGCVHCSRERNNLKLTGRKIPIDIKNLGDVFKDKLRKKYPHIELKFPDGYVSSAKPHQFICTKHDSEFTVTPANILCGRICGECLQESRPKKRTRKINWELRKDVFLEKMKHSKYRVKDPDQYVFNLTPMTFICEDHGEFEMTPVNMIRGCRCGACNSMSSKPEQLVVDTLPPNISLRRNIKRFLGSYELDIFLPDQMIGVEVNGVNWHSDRSKDRNYHLNKTVLAKDKGIHLYHFWDTEVNEKLHIIQSMLKTKIGISNKIFARQTSIKEIDSETARMFIHSNHIQDSQSVIGKHAFGLYDKETLVSVMTFGSSRFNKDVDFELIRFCSLLNTVVVGGASKLLKHARKTLGYDKSIISYANRRWSDGNLYKKLGFKHTHDSTPGYYYTNGNNLISRMQAQKHKLPELLGSKFDSNKTEEENMALAGWYRCYDCGNMVFVLRP